MTSWPVLQFSGYGSFDHEASIREAVLILVLSRPEEGMVCSVLSKLYLECSHVLTCAHMSYIII